MTVAADTRAAVRERPFLHTALRAGIVNYTAAARFLQERADVSAADEEAIAAALRRYADELDDYELPERRASVSIRSGIDPADAATAADALLSVGDTAFAADGGELTAVVAGGEVDADALCDVLARLRTADVGVVAAAGVDGTLAVVVSRRDGPDTVRAVENAL